MYKRPIREPGLVAAIKAVGSPTELAKLLKIKPQAVHQWREIPPRRVLKVAHLTGVPLHKLRPDLYPAPERVA